ncbi:unnamed protein product [Rotaria sp. Silwood1]|nr:unnamed protein product [Rotaria sp. Silwood1]
MAENYFVIWAHNSTDPANQACQNILAQLRDVVNEVKSCTTIEEFIQTLNENKEKLAFIVCSGTFSQYLVPDIHDMEKIHAIYILCGNKQRYKVWANNWTKVKGIHTSIKSICEALVMVLKQLNESNMPVSIISETEADSNENLDQLEPKFMYTQIFKEILLDIEHDEKAIKDLTNFCRELYKNNDAETKIINEFEHTYQPLKAIWWYTRECFTYKMLNGALRTLNGDIIIRMGVFLRDVHRQIEALHKKQVNQYDGKDFKVYRGQGLSKNDFDKLENSKRGLLSFNNFLSTSTKREVSLAFAKGALGTTGMVGILFEMTIDPNITSTPFASIREVSDFVEEDEVLFSMHTVFRINDIKKLDDKRPLYQINLKLTSDDDKKLRQLTDLIRKESPGPTGWTRLGRLLLKIGQYDKAEELYTTLLEQASNDSDKASMFHHLGEVKNYKGQYKEAVSFFEQFFEINRKIFPEDNPAFITFYNNIGEVYRNMGNHTKALEFYEKAVKIFEKHSLLNHPYLMPTYNNIGSLYKDMGNYFKALEFYNKSNQILEKTLPANHPNLSVSYNNIGGVYKSMGYYLKALEFLEKALKIKEIALPPNHPSLAVSYSNIAGIYKHMDNYSKAIEYYEKDIEISEKTLSPNHPELATSYTNIGAVYDEIGDYSKALQFHERAIKIKEIALPSNHSSLATCYNNIATAYTNMGNYSKAIEYFEKDLKISEKTLSSNHPNLATSYTNMGTVSSDMGDYWKALLFFEKAHKIYENALPANHSSLAMSYTNLGSVYHDIGDYTASLKALQTAFLILQKALKEDKLDASVTYIWLGRVYRSMKDYSKALEYFEKCLAIFQKVLQEKHPHLAILYTAIGDVHRLMGDYEKALLFHRKALDIQETGQGNPLKCAATYTNIGETYREMKNYSTALTYFQKALQIREDKLPKNHPHLAEIYHNLAKLYLATEEYSMAMKNIQQAIDIGHKQLSSTHPHLLNYKNTFEEIQNKL